MRSRGLGTLQSDVEHAKLAALSHDDGTTLALRKAFVVLQVNVHGCSTTIDKEHSAARNVDWFRQMHLTYIVMAYTVMAYTVMADTVMAYTVVADTVMAYIVMADTVMAYTVMAYIVMAYTVMAYTVMAYTVMAYTVMAYIVMAYIVIAYIVMALFHPRSHADRRNGRRGLYKGAEIFSGFRCFFYIQLVCPL